MKLLAILCLISLVFALPNLHEISQALLKNSNPIVGDTIQCIKDNCPNEYKLCQADPKCIPALESCQQKCGNSQSCWTFCLPGKGSDAAIDAVKCGTTAKCLNLGMWCLDKYLWKVSSSPDRITMFSFRVSWVGIIPHLINNYSKFMVLHLFCPTGSRSENIPLRSPSF